MLRLTGSAFPRNHESIIAVQFPPLLPQNPHRIVKSIPLPLRSDFLPMTGGARTSTSTTPPRFKRTATRRCSKKAIKAVESKTNGEDFEVEDSSVVGPVPRRLLLPQPQLGSILPRKFFEIDSLDLAPRLLGKYLRRDNVVLLITEVEAYRPNDSACHGRVGITPRTAPLFGPGGHAYVYLCYGMHMMLNVVADEEGVGAAVLIRSCAPISGLEEIQERRGQKTDKPILLTGPGKVGQALGISTDWSHHPFYESGGLEILDGPELENILIGPRVGIDYALPEHVSAPWRFAIADTPWISAPKNTLKPR
ncbi:DNA-3-methyladenine glycosylase [Rhynchospora pubera]|uniref:DNA-3-methyladenine glycosylase II n=1 Tax=Rhynchospora pubera TaxID=906938 RepID=A0AAV8FP97_9POAL|nr:DNA-3-methyladenine glycosylase [Rhynchospora pubera]